MAEAEVLASGTLEDWSAHTDDDLKESQLQERIQEVWRGNSMVHEAALKEGALGATRYALMAIYQARHNATLPDDLIALLYEEQDLHTLRAWLVPFSTEDPTSCRSHMT